MLRRLGPSSPWSRRSATTRSARAWTFETASSRVAPYAMATKISTTSLINLPSVPCSTSTRNVISAPISLRAEEIYVRSRIPESRGPRPSVIPRNPAPVLIQARFRRSRGPVAQVQLLARLRVGVRPPRIALWNRTAELIVVAPCGRVAPQPTVDRGGDAWGVGPATDVDQRGNAVPIRTRYRESQRRQGLIDQEHTQPPPALETASRPGIGIVDRSVELVGGVIVRPSTLPPTAGEIGFPQPAHVLDGNGRKPPLGAPEELVEDLDHFGSGRNSRTDLPAPHEPGRIPASCASASVRWGH